MNSNWQHIEEGELKHSSVHHLMAIQDLREKYGYARVTDISNYLEITRGSVSITMNKLNEGGFIEYDANKHITLTQKGKAIVNRVQQKYNLIKSFFMDNLLLDEESAQNFACKMEHVLSDTIVDKIQKLSAFLSEQSIKSQLEEYLTDK